MAGVLGIEPRVQESKSCVIPFHYTPTVCLVVVSGIEPANTVMSFVRYAQDSLRPPQHLECTTIFVVGALGVEPRLED